MKASNIFLVTFLVITFGISKGYSQNTSYGVDANPLDSGSNNSAFGLRALKTVNGNLNSAFGKEAMLNASGNHNSAFGANALRNVNQGYNSAFGSESLLNNNNGASNSSFGASALKLNTSGSFNVALGRSASENITGSNNVSVGAASLFHPTEGNNNTALGYWAGYALTSGSNNVFLGYKSGPASNQSINDKLFIGNNQGDFPLIWGDMNDNARYLRVNLRKSNVGSGDINARFEINAASSNASGLRFTRLNSTFNPSTNATKFLTVDQNGDVELRNLPLSAGGEDTSIYSHDGTLQENRTVLMDNKRLMFNTSDHGRIYIGNTTNVTDNENFPTETGNYRLYVEGGILTEKVKVALRNPDTNWADYVFADDYQLKSLKEVEAFIKENKHLPGIESAQELVENGLDLAEMQAKQMGKIEELTLYIIEQEKKLEKQSKDIEELRRKLELLLNDKN